MARADPLAKYNAKRDFSCTAEPAGKVDASGGHRFIVPACVVALVCLVVLL